MATCRPPQAQQSPRPDAGEGGAAASAARRRQLLLGMLLSAAVGCPEAYGVLLSCPCSAGPRAEEGPAPLYLDGRAPLAPLGRRTAWASPAHASSLAARRGPSSPPHAREE